MLYYNHLQEHIEGAFPGLGVCFVVFWFGFFFKLNIIEALIYQTYYITLYGPTAYIVFQKLFSTGTLPLYFYQDSKLTGHYCNLLFEICFSRKQIVLIVCTQYCCNSKQIQSETGRG